MTKIKWKYEIGDRVVDYKDDGSLKRDLTIIDRKIEIRKVNSKHVNKGYFMSKIKYYKYHCNVCGWNEGWIRESDLFVKKTGCSCCCSRTTVKGVNDIATTHPHLVRYFKNKDEAFLYCACSNHCPELICPTCGTIKTKLALRTLTRHGFGCQTCSDGISYAEKFVNSFLKQLNVEYKPQLTRTTYQWCNGYRYDFWFKFNNEEYIIETHGLQHYEKQNNWNDNVEENDRIKQQLANDNGFNNEHYIVLDCRYSDLDWIKNSIINSVISHLFDLSKIDWCICHEMALKTLVRDVCEYWEKNKYIGITTVDVAKHFQISSKTIRLYLHQGNDLKWCVYNGKEELEKNGKKLEKKVIALDNNMNVIKIFDSCLEVEMASLSLLGSTVKRNTVSHTCAENDRKKEHYLKGYYFWYLEDYIKEHQDFDYTKYLDKTA